MGAHQFSFDIDAGIGRATIPPGRPLDLPALESAVEKAGFALEWTGISALGRLSPTDDPHRLELGLERHAGQRIVLVPGPSAAEREVFEQLRGLAGQGATVRVKGRSAAHAGEGLALSAQSFERLGERR